MEIKIKRAFTLLNKFRYEIIALIFTFYGLYLRLLCLANRNFWTDENYSLNFMRGAFKPVWQRVNYTDFTYFPGEYIINWPFVSIFGANKWGISIPHIFSTILGFYFLYLICKRYLTSVFAWVAAFALVATHRELIVHSFELRPYAVLATLSLAVFYFAENIVSSRYRVSRPRKILIGLFFIFTIIYHSYGSIILFFVFAYFLLRESRESGFGEVIKRNYRFIGAMAIIGLPLFLWYSLGNPEIAKGLNYNVFEYIPNPLSDLWGFIKNIVCSLIGNKLFYATAIFLLFPFLLSFPDRWKQAAFLLILVVLPVLVIFYISLLVNYWFLQRQFIWVAPLLAFLISWCIDSLMIFIRRKRKGGSV